MICFVELQSQILADLSHKFTRVNDLCLSLQGKITHVLNCYENLNAFKDKWSL